MIPKIIHFCWLGGGKKSPLIEACVNSWTKLMPDWTLMEWNESNFDTEKNRYVRDAIKNKKYAFASDYIRLYALYNYGGIYLDTDVLLLSSLESFRNNKMFTAHECFLSIFINYQNSIDSKGVHIPSMPIGGFGIMSAVIGAEKGHWFIKECLDYYQNLEFRINELLIIDGLMATMLEKYGYRYKDELQILRDIVIYPSHIFLTDKTQAMHNAVAIHWCAGSWYKLSLSKRIMFSYPLFALKYYKMKGILKRILNK